MIVESGCSKIIIIKILIIKVAATPAIIKETFNAGYFLTCNAGYNQGEISRRLFSCPSDNCALKRTKQSSMFCLCYEKERTAAITSGQGLSTDE